MIGQHIATYGEELLSLGLLSEVLLVASPPEAWIKTQRAIVHAHRVAGVRGSGSIEWTTDGEAATLKHVGVNHRRTHVLVPQKFLHGTDVVTILKQVGCKTMAEGVTTDALGDARFLSGLLDRALQSRRIEMMAAHLPSCAWVR